MKKTKLLYIPIILVLILIIGWCISKNPSRESTSKYDSPEEVIENYFIFTNEKNKDGILTTVTDRYTFSNYPEALENQMVINLEKIEENPDERYVEEYINSLRGKSKGLTKDNVKAFKVQYYQRFKEDNSFGAFTGTHYRDYILIRDNENSPWLIDDLGKF